MSRRRASGVRVAPEPAPLGIDKALEETVTLPPRPVLEAGVDKFLELTAIGVGRKGTDAFQSFNFTDRRLLAVVLGLTFLHMRSTYTQELGKELGKEAQ